MVGERDVAEHHDMTVDDSKLESLVDGPFDGAVYGAVTSAASRVTGTHTTWLFAILPSGRSDDAGPAV